MATWVGRGKMQLAAFDALLSKTHCRRKDLAKIFYGSRVVANFVPNIVAMTKVVSQLKMQLAAFVGPSLKNLL